MPPEDVCGISRNFSRLSPCEGQVAYALLTRAPVADRSVATPSLPLDLHVLSLSLAFILSQDQTLRCLSCSLFFSVIPTARPTTSDRPGICALFSLDGGLPPSSFVLSLYRIISMFSAPFPFRKAVTKVLPLFLTAKFFANFFSSFFSRTPRPRRSDALRHHAQASRPPVCFAFAVAKVLLSPFPAKLFSIFFCPFFQYFLQSFDSPPLIPQTFFSPISPFCDRNKPQLFTHIIIYLRADIFL